MQKALGATRRESKKNLGSFGSARVSRLCVRRVVLLTCWVQRAHQFVAARTVIANPLQRDDFNASDGNVVSVSRAKDASVPREEAQNATRKPNRRAAVPCKDDYFVEL